MLLSYKGRNNLIAPKQKAEVTEYIEAFIIAIVLALFIITFIAQSFLVQGSSMEPTLHDKERLLVNKFVYRYKPPVRGDIVVFKYPSDPRRKFIKRVIGRSGDSVEIKDTRVLVNGKELKEDYIFDKTYGDFGPSKVPDNTIFVLGDNRNNSEDSRFPDVGFVPRKNIVGKAFVVYWPLSNLSLPPRH
jgi:signal peptidase I